MIEYQKQHFNSAQHQWHKKPLNDEEKLQSQNTAKSLFTIKTLMQRKPLVVPYHQSYTSIYLVMLLKLFNISFLFVMSMVTSQIPGSNQVSWKYSRTKAAHLIQNFTDQLVFSQLYVKSMKKFFIMRG